MMLLLETRVGSGIGMWAEWWERTDEASMGTSTGLEGSSRGGFDSTVFSVTTLASEDEAIFCGTATPLWGEPLREETAVGGRLLGRLTTVEPWA